uniref:Uncharacterized protein n=1 Tax=Mesocestoides corti TaxID=53468 RepID=A0A5K3FET2_MESCO
MPLDRRDTGLAMQRIVVPKFQPKITSTLVPNAQGLQQWRVDLDSSVSSARSTRKRAQPPKRRTDKNGDFIYRYSDRLVRIAETAGPAGVPSASNSGTCYDRLDPVVVQKMEIIFRRRKSVSCRVQITCYYGMPFFFLKYIVFPQFCP